jgi:ABC-type transport system involved in multi-copper enzyme maturation permease subunit
MSMNFLVAGCYSLGISQLTLALLGGHAIACERADRSAEFLAYLPLSRAKNLAGKMMLALAVLGLIWVPNLLVLQLAIRLVPESAQTQLYHVGWIALGNIAITGFVFFGVGWLLSSVLESPTFAICGGLATPLLVVMGIGTVAWFFAIPDELARPLYVGTCLLLAPLCFVVGTVYYLRRVEP